MKYILTLNFEEGISKEKIDWLVATLRYKKTLHYSAEFPVESVDLAVADVEPEPDYYDPLWGSSNS
jgi:hypothetical protein